MPHATPLIALQNALGSQQCMHCGFTCSSPAVLSISRLPFISGYEGWTRRWSGEGVGEALVGSNLTASGGIPQSFDRAKPVVRVLLSVSASAGSTHRSKHHSSGCRKSREKLKRCVCRYELLFYCCLIFHSEASLLLLWCWNSASLEGPYFTAAPSSSEAFVFLRSATTRTTRP